MKKHIVLTGLAALAGVGYAFAQVTLPQVSAVGSSDLVQIIPGGTPVLGNQYVSASLLANLSGTPRNYLDNGAQSVIQRGTGTITCAANAAITNAAYVADRWGCSANVGSGAGRGQVITASPAPPVGFTNSVKLWRNSGALTQPVCYIQEIPSVRATYLAGKSVSLSWQGAALAGLAADNGNVMTASIFYGTGTDEGLQTMTASPAITPAWTGIAFATGANQTAVSMSGGTTFTRYSLNNITIPATATEVGVALCFTPTATGAGATDGLAVTGIQLEVAPLPSAFEFQPYPVELANAQRYYYKITETAAITPIASCAVSTTSLGICLVPFPQVMRTVPTMTYATGFAMTVAAQTSVVTCTGNGTASAVASTAVNTLAAPVTCTSAAGFGAAGTVAQLFSNNGTGTITAFADF